MAAEIAAARSARSAPRHGVAVHRLPLLLFGMVALLAGVTGGLARAGWPLAVGELPALHGPLMVAAFFGTVIGLERAVALGRWWAYQAPLAAGIGGIALLAGFPIIGAGLQVYGSAVLTLASLFVHLNHRHTHTLTLAMGAAAWFAACLAWAFGVPPGRLVGLWMGFLVLTIAGERLELTRFLPPSAGARRVFGGLIALLIAGMVVVVIGGGDGQPMLAIALVGLALWLLRQDVARRTIHQQGLTRYIAVCLLAGYFWLAFGGLVWLLAPEAALADDAALHAVFVGFVFSMVFGHAPVIFPAVLRVRLPYQPVFYLPLALLHVSLLVRCSGDLFDSTLVRGAGALFNAVALGVFILTMLITVLRAHRH